MIHDMHPHLHDVCASSLYFGGQDSSNAATTRGVQAISATASQIPQHQSQVPPFQPVSADHLSLVQAYGTSHSQDRKQVSRQMLSDAVIFKSI